MPVFQLTEDVAFPPPGLATSEGLLAVGGDLSEQRLLLAYTLGIFPWYSEGEPILWWSPDPRMVLLLESFRPPRSMRRANRDGRFNVTMDTAFDQVMAACATVPRAEQDGTWITEDMMAAYSRLHRSGYAHSVECWHEDELVGGLYGISLGSCFFGESMFSTMSGASKVALLTLVDQLRKWDFTLIDCQIYSEHLERLGARDVRRETFLDMLETGVKAQTRAGVWRFECA